MKKKHSTGDTGMVLQRESVMRDNVTCSFFSSLNTGYRMLYLCGRFFEQKMAEN